MYKMLIVDDEYIVRKGIKETIDWERYNVTITHEAKHGQEALDIIKHHAIDIVITDIRMPIMDGVTLIKELSHLTDDLGIVVLSGYQDFEYAKHALENGAFSYLLKPIANQELIDKVLDVINHLKIQREKESLVETIQEDIPNIKRQLIYEVLEGRVDTATFIKKATSYKLPVIHQGVVIYMQDEVKDNQGASQFYACVIEALTAENVTYYYYHDQDTYSVIVQTDTLKAVQTILESALKRYQQVHIEPLYIGVSNLFTEISGIKEAYESAQENALKKPYPLINMVMSPLDDLTLKPQLKSCLMYISQHYHENITVKTVADHLYVSESYLMHAFKNQLNKTFNEYLTAYRLNKAKELLLTSHYHIYEVATKVGYGDVKYFSQVFRKHLGMTPSDYVKQFKT